MFPWTQWVVLTHDLGVLKSTLIHALISPWFEHSFSRWIHDCNCRNKSLLCCVIVSPYRLASAHYSHKMLLLNLVLSRILSLSNVSLQYGFFINVFMLDFDSVTIRDWFVGDILSYYKFYLFYQDDKFFILKQFDFLWILF